MKKRTGSFTINWELDEGLAAIVEQSNFDDIPPPIKAMIVNSLLRNLGSEYQLHVAVDVII